MSSPSPSPGRKIRTFEVVVSNVIWETPDTVTLEFEGPGPFEYKAGQFLTIDPHQFPQLARFTAHLEVLKGKKEPPRAYSMVSAPHETLGVTVKAEVFNPGQTKYPPLLSPYLTYEVTKGQKMTVTGFTGPYTLPDDILQKTDHIVHLTAGSGSVPNFSILKHALKFIPRLRHTFLYSNKTWDDVIYRDALNALAREYPDRLRVFHRLTRQDVPPDAPPGTARGRINAEFLREVIPDPNAVVVYACGPALAAWDKAAAREKGEEPAPRFMETILEALKAIGLPKDRLKKEEFG